MFPDRKPAISERKNRALGRKTVSSLKLEDLRLYTQWKLAQNDHDIQLQRFTAQYLYATLHKRIFEESRKNFQRITSSERKRMIERGSTKGVL